MVCLLIVSGGVMSGIGKGITSSSVGLLLSKAGYLVDMVKIDPYLNQDAGMMNPYEHGECFVMQSGLETDLDIGNYQRFLGKSLDEENAITGGQIYADVLRRERAGDYLGQTVQTIPHVRDEICHRFDKILSKKEGLDYLIVELGGTAGDIESLIFYRAFLKLSKKVQVKHVHVTSLVENNGELKTKPAQTSLQILHSVGGVIPDILCVRLPKGYSDISEKLSDKLGSYHQLIVNPHCDTIYQVPFVFHEQNILEKIGCRKKLDTSLLSPYNSMISLLREKPKVKIAIAGKYMGTPDAYLSLHRALEHAMLKVGFLCNIEWWDVEEVHIGKLETLHGIIIPGGFGKRGTENMILFIEKARSLGIPVLGICLGFQLMVVEYARNVLKLNAGSSEFGSYDHPVISSRPSPSSDLGGTMHLGSKKVILSKPLQEIYETEWIDRRFRCRYGFDFRYFDIFTDFEWSGRDICSLKDKEFYHGVQYHPEFTSTLETPDPIFVSFLLASQTLSNGHEGYNVEEVGGDKKCCASSDQKPSLQP